MRRLSEADYRALEQKIHAAVSKAFLEFMEEPGRESSESDGSKTTPRLRKSGARGSRGPRKEPPPARSALQRSRKVRKSMEIDRILSKAGPAGTGHTPKKTIDSDIEKIFRNKRRHKTL